MSSEDPQLSSDKYQEKLFIVENMSERHKTQQTESRQERKEDNEESDLKKLSPDDLFKLLIDSFKKEGLTFDGEGSTSDKLRWLDSMYGYFNQSVNENPHHQSSSSVGRRQDF